MFCGVHLDYWWIYRLNNIRPFYLFYPLSFSILWNLYTHGSPDEQIPVYFVSLGFLVRLGGFGLFGAFLNASSYSLYLSINSLLCHINFPLYLMFCCGFVDYTAGKRKSKEENAGNFSFYMLLNYMRSILLFLISQNLLKRRS